MDLLAQPPFRADTEAIADNQHPDQQLGIDRGSSYLAVVGFKMRPNRRQIDEAVDLAQEVIVRDMTLKAEPVEQRLLHHPTLAHHGVSPRFAVKLNQQRVAAASDFFNKIGRYDSFADLPANDGCSRTGDGWS